MPRLIQRKSSLQNNLPKSLEAEVSEVAAGAGASEGAGLDHATHLAEQEPAIQHPAEGVPINSKDCADGLAVDAVIFPLVLDKGIEQITRQAGI